MNWKECVRSGHRLIEGTMTHLCQEDQCSSQDLYWIPPKNKSEALAIIRVSSISFMVKCWVWPAGTVPFVPTLHSFIAWILLQCGSIWLSVLFMGYAMVQAVSHQLLTTKDQVQSQNNPCGICGAQTDFGTGFSLKALIFPVSRIPHILQAHSVTYRWHYVISTIDSIVK